MGLVHPTLHVFHAWLDITLMGLNAPHVGLSSQGAYFVLIMPHVCNVILTTFSMGLIVLLVLKSIIVCVVILLPTVCSAKWVTILMVLTFVLSARLNA